MIAEPPQLSGGRQWVIRVGVLMCQFSMCKYANETATDGLLDEVIRRLIMR